MTRRFAPRFWRDRRGATAVEFAFVAPIVFALTFGIIEFGLILFEYHSVGEAARFGARELLIADPLANLTSIKTTSPVCTGTSDTQVSCTGTKRSGADAAFAAIVARMKNKAPKLKGINLQITYSDSTVTDPDVTPGLATPMITLSVRNYQYNYIILQYIPGVPATFTLPEFSTTRAVHTVNAT